MLTGTFPLFFTTTCCASLTDPTAVTGKFKALVLRLTLTAMPVPERVTVCGELGALSAIVSDAWRLPVALGLNVMEIVQLAPGATRCSQLLVCRYDPAAAPVKVIPDM